MTHWQLYRVALLFLMLTSLTLCVSLVEIKIDYYFDSVPGAWIVLLLFLFLLLFCF